jgi:hypothetical protein
MNTALVNTFLDLFPIVFKLTKIETFPAISYEQALILPTDKNLSSTESA